MIIFPNKKACVKERDNFRKVDDTGLLDLRNMGLTRFPEIHGDIGTIHQLDLRNNTFKEFPREIVNLPIERLDISGLGFDKFPTEITNLNTLKAIYLRNNRILPKKFDLFPSLEELYLEDNELTALSKKIGNLNRLRVLGLARNELKTLPREIGHLNNLEFLFLQDNKLNVIPETIGKATNLYQINLSKNPIQNLPEEFGDLKRLRNLLLDGTPIVLDDSVTKLQLTSITAIDAESIDRKSVV